ESGRAALRGRGARDGRGGLLRGQRLRHGLQAGARRLLASRPAHERHRAGGPAHRLSRALRGARAILLSAGDEPRGALAAGPSRLGRRASHRDGSGRHRGRAGEAIVTIATRIAEWVAHTDLDSVLEVIQARTRLCCLDTVGVALAGVEAPSVHAAARAFASDGGYGFWSQPGSADLAGACFVNATAASALDLDDGYALVVGHAASSAVPSVLTFAQRAAVSGRAALAAVALGYEVAVRAALAREDMRVDALSSGGWTPLGVAAALGRLAGLRVAQQAHALAIAAAYRPQAPLEASLADGAMVKESIGWGTLAGVHAVSLAAAGFEGALTILDRDGAEAAWLDDLGRRWAVGESYFKAYAACRWTHAPVDAVLSLRRR